MFYELFAIFYIMNDLINIIHPHLLTIILIIVGIGGYIFAFAATGSYPFRGKFKWNDLMPFPFEEDTPPRKKVFRDNTDRIIKRSKARKVRCKHWPVVENPKWKKNQTKYDCISGKYVNTKYSEPTIIQDTSPLYEIEPYTGKKRKINAKISHPLVSIPYNKFVYENEYTVIMFYVGYEIMKFYNIQLGQKVRLESGNPSNDHTFCDVVIDSLENVNGQCVITHHIIPPKSTPKTFPHIKPQSLVERWRPVLESRIGSNPPRPTPPPLDHIYA